jgi:hypothetical protein
MPAGQIASNASAEDIGTLFEELVRSRKRLAELSPLTGQDIESARRAVHELVWYLLTPSPHDETLLSLPQDKKAVLFDAAHNRDLDLYVLATSVLARKLALQGSARSIAIDQVDIIRDALDKLTFDYLSPKKETLATLREIRADLDARIGYVSRSRTPGFRFLEQPERYSERKDKRERPDQFFRRVYGQHVPRGLTQRDIRHIDPKFYNVLHVWCTRHERKLASFLPPARSR